MKRKYVDLLVQKQTEIESEEIEIKSLITEKNAVEEELAHLEMVKEHEKETSDQNQKVKIVNLKQIVTKEEKFVEDLVAVIREHTAT